jgi:hypothetical protein
MMLVQLIEAAAPILCPGRGRLVEPEGLARA